MLQRQDCSASTRHDLQTTDENNAMNERRITLAAMTLLELPPPEVVGIAARAGYQGVGLRLVPATPDAPHFPLVESLALRRETLARLRDTGLLVDDIEILRLKPDMSVAAFEPVFAVAQEFGAKQALIAGNDDDESRTIDNFAKVCELAARYGISPHLEFMPWTAVRELRQAQRIVQAANCDNGRILVDAFHFDRSGSRLQDLERVPPSLMQYAQLCDVIGPRPEDMDEILRQARDERRFPGDGFADLLGFLRALPPDITLSLEVPTRKLVEQGVPGYDRARMAIDKTRELLALAAAHDSTG